MRLVIFRNFEVQAWPGIQLSSSCGFDNILCCIQHLEVVGKFPVSN